MVVTDFEIQRPPELDRGDSALRLTWVDSSAAGYVEREVSRAAERYTGMAEQKGPAEGEFFSRQGRGHGC
jgi:hypothetical protein